MPTVTVYPISTIQGDWTPSTPGPDHHLLVDEVGAPNETDYVQVPGFSAGKIEKFGLGQCPATINRITQVKFRVRIKGIPADNEPAIRVEVLLNGGVIAAYEGGCSTGVYATLTIIVTGLNILRNDWNAGSPTIVFTPRNGDTGYPDWNQEA